MTGQVPTEGIFDAPGASVCINTNWLSFIDSQVARLKNRDLWDGDNTEKSFAVDQIELLLAAFGEIGVCRLTPIGAVTMWLNATPPDGWKILNGDGLSKTTYPELFALFGYTYGGGGDTFNLPTMASMSPMGVGGFIALGETKGNTQANIAKANLPLYNLTVTDTGHVHTINDPGHTHPPAAGTTVIVGRTAGGTTDWVRATAGATFRQDNNTGSNTTGISVNSGGGGVSVSSGGSGNALDIVHPVRGVYFIIFAGR